MKIISRAYSSNSDYNAECDYALIDIPTVEDAQLLLDRISLVKQLKEGGQGTAGGDVLKIIFWAHHASFFSSPDDEWEESHEGALPDTEDYVIVDDGINEPTETLWGPIELDMLDVQSTEMDTVQVYDDGCAWESGAKHTDINVETAKIPTSVLEEYVKQCQSSK